MVKSLKTHKKLQESFTSAFREMAAVEHGVRTLQADTEVITQNRLCSLGSSLDWDPVFFPARTQAGDPLPSHH